MDLISNTIGFALQATTLGGKPAKPPGTGQSTIDGVTELLKGTNFGSIGGYNINLVHVMALLVAVGIVALILSAANESLN